MEADQKFQLKGLAVSEFNLENIGIWPANYRALVCSLALIIVLVGGYFLHVKDLYETLTRATDKEIALRATYQKKAFEAANLEAYKEQMAELEKSFSVLLAQLPGDTEVPGLLEDITELGYGSSLEIKTISLQPEKAKEFYIELPIHVVAQGGYHDVGTFVSGIASLPRIVTLHDYSLKAGGSQDQLVFEVQAKTYRYKGQDE